MYQGCEACFIALSSSPEISDGEGQTGPSPTCLRSSQPVGNMRSVPRLSGLKATTVKTVTARKLSQQHSCAKVAPAFAGLPVQLLWDAVETFTATSCGTGRSPLSTQIPPALPAEQWLKGRRTWRNPSAHSLPQQDPFITSLCCTSVKAVYLFSLFQAVQFLPVICSGQCFPPTLKLCPFASVEKTTSFFLLFSPKHGFLFPYTHFFFTKPPRLSEQGMDKGACCGSGWKCVTLKPKLGKALNPGPQKLVLSTADVVCV